MPPSFKLQSRVPPWNFLSTNALISSKTAVHSDRPYLRVCFRELCGRGEESTSRTAGGMVNDIVAGLVHAECGLLALAGIAESREIGRGGQVLHVDVDVGLDV